MKAVSSILSLFALAKATPLPSMHTHSMYGGSGTASDHARFSQWMQTHGVAYGTEEQQHKFGVWVANDAFITATNALNLSYTVAHNQFSALTGAEFKKLYLSYQMPTKTNSTEAFDFTGDVGTLAAAVDWTTKGAVTPVKDQGQVGASTGGLLFVVVIVNNCRG